MHDVPAATGGGSHRGARFPPPGPPERPPAPDTGGGGRWRTAWERLDRNGLRAFWVATAVVLGLQLVLFLAVSTYRYHRFDLYTDFGTYAQAFSVIAHGNLRPFDTFQTYPFWQNHFELAMWPIGLLGSLWPHPIVLLWMQDIAVVATELVALLWVGRICIERVGGLRRQVALLALVATAANVWWWEATIFDVHFETFGMPFALLGAYALWRGHHGTAWAAAIVGGSSATSSRCHRLRRAGRPSLGPRALAPPRRVARDGVGRLRAGLADPGHRPARQPGLQRADLLRLHRPRALERASGGLGVAGTAPARPRTRRPTSTCCGPTSARDVAGWPPRRGAGRTPHPVGPAAGGVGCPRPLGPRLERQRVVLVVARWAPSRR